MYLVSIYFDESTNHRIKHYMEAAAKKSGNTQMMDGSVPPHITISSFETTKEDIVIAHLEEAIKQIKKGSLQVASIGAFPSNVLFLSPVLTEYLHALSETIFDSITKVEEIKISRYYRPFGWMPHLTIAKALSKEEMLLAFQEIQKEFQMFNGEVVRIGLAKTNPYRDIVSWEI